MLAEQPLRWRVATRSMSVPVAIVAGSVALAALSLLLPSTPTYDPWAWIVWGREITQLDLDTVDGPSWKPLPVIFTTVFALFGDAAPDLWLVVARAGAIAAIPLGFLLASRLAGPVAGAAAAAGIALAPWWYRNGSLGNSEGLLVALLFGAVLAHVAGRRGWAFVLALGVGLLRPEAWPFVGLYALWLLWDDRTRLRWVAAGLVSLPILWLGPELWGSGNPLRASDRAQQPNPDSPAFAEHPTLEVLENAIAMISLPAVIGCAVLLVLLVTRRAPGDRAGLAGGLAALALAWTGLVAVMTSTGFSGNQRYLMPPAALLIVLGAAGIVWAFAFGAAAWRGRRRDGVPVLAGGAPRPGRRAVLLTVAALAAAFAFTIEDADRLSAQTSGVEYQAELTADLQRVIDRAGGAAFLRRCGHAYTNPLLVPALAWHLRVHSEHVGLDPDEERPAVVFHVKHVSSARGRAPAWAQRGRNELARAGSWIVTADCEPAR